MEAAPLTPIDRATESLAEVGEKLRQAAGHIVVAILGPPLSDDAARMLAAVDADPNASEAMLSACIDALEECGATMQASSIRFRLILLRMHRQLFHDLVESFRLSPELLSGNPFGGSDVRAAHSMYLATQRRF